MSFPNINQSQQIGLLPAAGRGTRLGVPFPKELFPLIINNTYKPVSQFSLEYIRDAGVHHIVFVINQLKQEIIGYFGNGSKFGVNISYVVQEAYKSDDAVKSPGLAHALDSAYHLTKNKCVLFCMPDTIIYPAKFFSNAINSAPEDSDAILILFPTDTPEKYGMVEMSDSLSIKRIVDKPRISNLQMMWGAIIWSPRFTDFLHSQVSDFGNGDFADILNNAISHKLKVFGYEVSSGMFFDVGTPDEVVKIYKLLT